MVKIAKKVRATRVDVTTSGLAMGCRRLWLLLVLCMAVDFKYQSLPMPYKDFLCVCPRIRARQYGIRLTDAKGTVALLQKDKT